MDEEDDTMEIQEKEVFPLLLSEKNTETGEVTRYYVSLSEYHKNLFESVDLMNDEGILSQKEEEEASLFILIELDALRLRITQRKKILKKNKKD